MVWDPFIRGFHWMLVLGIVLNYWLLEGGESTHEWLGYGVAGLILARLLWGFLGPRNARFASFVRSPRAVLNSIQHFSRHYREEEGHSPLAGWMILTQLTVVTATGVSGWMQELDAFWGEEWLQNLHEWLAHTIIALAAVHVAAVLIIQWRLQIPLIQRMLRG